MLYQFYKRSTYVRHPQADAAATAFWAASSKVAAVITLASVRILLPSSSLVPTRRVLLVNQDTHLFPLFDKWEYMY